MIFEGVRKLVHATSDVVDVVAHNPEAQQFAGRVVRVIGRGVDGAAIGLVVTLAASYLIIKKAEGKNSFAAACVFSLYLMGFGIALSTIAGVGYELSR